MAKFSVTFFIGITDDNLDIPGVEFTADPGVAETAANYKKDGVALLRLSSNRLVKSTALTEDYVRSDETNEDLFYIDAEFDVPDEALKQTLGVDSPENIDPSNFMFVCGEFTKIAATPGFKITHERKKMKLVQIHYTFVIDGDEALEECQSVEELDNYVGRKFSQSLTDLDGLLHHELASLLDYSDFPDELYHQISNKQK